MEPRPIARCYGFIATHVVRGPQGSVKPGSGPVTSVDAGHTDAAVTFLKNRSCGINSSFLCRKSDSIDADSIVPTLSIIIYGVLLYTIDVACHLREEVIPISSRVSVRRGNDSWLQKSPISFHRAHQYKILHLINRSCQQGVGFSAAEGLESDRLDLHLVKPSMVYLLTVPNPVTQTEP